MHAHLASRPARRVSVRTPHRAGPATWALRALFLGVLLALTAAEQPVQADDRPAAESGAPFVTALPLGAAPLPGQLIALGPKGITLRPTRGEATPQTVPLETLRSLRFPPAEGRAPSSGAVWRAHLVGGDVAIGTIVSADEENVTFKLPGIAALPLSFESIRTLEFVPESAGICHDSASRRPRSEDEDSAHLRGGDRFIGLLVEADAKGAVFEDDKERTRRFEWAQLDVVHLANDLLDAPKTLSATIECWNGTRLRAKTLPVLADGRVQFNLASAPETRVQIGLPHIAAIAFGGGRFVHASDLDWTATHKPYYPAPEKDVEARLARLRDRWWAVRADRRPDGCPLSVEGVIYRKGFAAHSGSVITLPLEGRYKRFEGAFSLDDAALRDGAGKGHVHARILADGKEIWKAENVVGGTSLRRIEGLDVKGVKRLELRVEYGEQNNFKDRASWIEPILVK